MRKYLSLLIIGAFLASCQTEQPKADHLVNATLWFQKSAEMRACYYQAYELASYKLVDYKVNYQGEKPTAVVLDIDETVLDNSPFEVHLIETGESYSPQLWKTWTDKACAKALPGALEFTKFAKQNGVEVIYISNRKVNELGSTIKNLDSLGFPNADSSFIYLKQATSNKTERRNLVNSQYEVLLYIGDNLTDFNEKYAKRGTDLGFIICDSTKNDFGNRYIILPNPMYGEWESAVYKYNYNQSAEEKQNNRIEALDKCPF